MVLYLHQVPARQGVLWVKHGFAVFRRSPLALTSLLFFSLFVSLLLPSLFEPLQIISFALPPFFSLAFMLATHRVVQGQRPTLTVFVAPWQVTTARRRDLLLLCLVYGSIMFGAALLAQQLDGGVSERLQNTPAPPVTDLESLRKAMFDPGLMVMRAVMMGATALLIVPFWHAPALVYWGGHGVAQALFSSTLAVWRNRSAFATYALTWLGLIGLMGLVFGVLAVIIGPLVIPLILTATYLLAMAINASFYFTFLDCFLSGVPADLNQSA